MRIVALLALALLAPLAFAGAPETRHEDYVAAGGGPASWAAACAQDLNVGAACFPLEGWEREVRVEIHDELSFFPSADWFALDANLLPISGGRLCFATASMPEGSAYFVVDFNPIAGMGVIPECRQSFAGTVFATFS